ncbi:putative WEB family protein [Helianthus annuus]|nr:putative WEB family protein [Helianthus annuus]
MLSLFPLYTHTQKHSIYRRLTHYYHWDQLTIPTLLLPPSSYSSSFIILILIFIINNHCHCFLLNMAEMLPSSVVSDNLGSETAKLMNPRVEIDTSPPFGSVKEAVTRFGGSGSWIPLHILRLAGHDLGEIDMETVEKQAVELEKELIIKEQETLEVLRELESAKGVMEGLKLNIMKEVSSILNLNPDSGTTVTSSDKSTASLTLCSVPLPPAIILSELKEAKLKLNRTTNDLAIIRASVETLNKKMRTHKVNLAENGDTKCVIKESIDVSNNGSHKPTFEAEQFRRMEEAAQYEVIKATSEIEHTKMSIKMVEMRLIAAKKMEEAARAMEAVACAESRPLVRDGITLSYEEYCELTQKARKAEDVSKKNDYHRKDANLSTMAFLKNSMDHTDGAKFRRKTLGEALGTKTDAANGRNLESKSGFPPRKPETHNHPKTRSSNPFRGHAPRRFEPLIGDYPSTINKESRPVLRTSVSIGDILSRKLILKDNIIVRDDVESQTQRDDPSLTEMLRDQSGLIFHDSSKTNKEGRNDKQFFSQRKKFGFIHVSLPLTKHNKKKSNPQTPQPLNMKYP